jgi:ParB/RepB/Spo0J family partition protein
MLLDPNTIRVEPRQRKTPADVGPMVASIAQVGQIHPIVVRRDADDGTPILIAGWTRLEACKQLGRLIDVVWREDLAPDEAELIELEENAKRTDLNWRDLVSTVGTLLTKFDWTIAKAAQRLSLSEKRIYDLRAVYRRIEDPRLRDAKDITQALGILRNISNRTVGAIVDRINSAGRDLFRSGQQPTPDNAQPTPTGGQPTSDTKPSSDTSAIASVAPVVAPRPARPMGIICTNFVSWAPTYNGPPFQLIHCDFPYDIYYAGYARSVTSTGADYDPAGFFDLLEVLCTNLDRLASYQSHLMLWFSMEYYEKTRLRLEESGLFVHRHPLVWLKSDNAGIIPGRDNKYPRRVYETALLCSRGDRPLVRPLANAYAAPTVQNPLHPSQKSEPMLRHFLSMLVDETTHVLDPTCGSGSALRAATSCGAASTLGIEINPGYVEGKV